MPRPVHHARSASRYRPGGAALARSATFASVTPDEPHVGDPSKIPEPVVRDAFLAHNTR